MADYFVDLYRGSDNWDGNVNRPKRTISGAAKAPLKRGDRIIVKPGIYKETVKIWTEGIFLLCETPNSARIDAKNLNAIPLQIGQPNVTVWGFDVLCNPNFAGVVVSDTYGAVLQKLTIRGAGGAGAYIRRSDHVSVLDCDIYGCSGYAAGSGISIHKPQIRGPEIDGYHFIIRNNRVHENRMITEEVAHTDGNGIILDEFEDFPYGALVEKNTIFLNGGDGVMVNKSFRASHLIRDNICWGNGTDLEGSGLYGAELGTRRSNYVTWLRNIGVSRQPRHNAVGNVSDEGKVNKDIVYSGNILYNEGAGSRLIRISTGNIGPTKEQLGINPNFINPPINFGRR